MNPTRFDQFGALRACYHRDDSAVSALSVHCQCTVIAVIAVIAVSADSADSADSDDSALTVH